MSTDTLHRLLDRQLEWPPETREQFTSHLPMALQALHALGASDARLHAFHEQYLARFASPRQGPPAAAAEDWRVLRGRPDVFPALRATFAGLLARDGEDAVLRAALPALLPGVAAAAFHGVIRTAHAVEARHRGELAAALAYWAWRWQPLAEAPAAAPLAFDDWAARLVASAPGWRTEQPSISRRMDAATASPTYRELAASLAPMPDLLPRLAALAVARYAETRNFTVLHMVTGLRALRVLSPWFGPGLGEAGEGAPILVRAFVAAYLAARVPAQPAVAPPRLRDWPAVIAAACASDDDHVIKIVHACREEAAAYGPGRYLEAASLAVS